MASNNWTMMKITFCEKLNLHNSDDEDAR